MKAVGYQKSLPIEDKDALIDFETAKPEPKGRDIRVAVKAVSVNPVDTKVRKRAHPQGGEPAKILGYDASGVVIAVGERVTLFSPGDEVYYAGSIARPGTNAQFHVVDERIAGHKPRTLTFAAAAALPLTTITAWETLFERFRLTPESAGTLLALAAAGGVGSMITQLARALTRVTVIGTASRPESRQWALDYGAHQVVNHHDLVAGVRGAEPDGVHYIFSPHTGGAIGDFAEILQPFGAITAIDEPEGLDLLPLKTKSITFHWELMFTRPLFEPPDMIVQHDVLDRVAGLVDEGTIRTTLSRELSPFNAETMRQAHAMVEEGRMTGKVVVSGF